MNRFSQCLVVTLAALVGDSAAKAQEQTLPTGDGYSVRSISFSPDGKILLTGHGADEPSLFARGHVKVWDVKSGKQLARLKARYAPVEALAFAPNGKSFAAGGMTLTIWDVESKKPFRELSDKYRTMALAYAPDGNALASCPAGDDFKAARIWDPATGKSLADLREHKGTVISVAFSADGTRLATSSYDDDRVILWDTATWKMSKALHVGFDGSFVASSPKNALLFVAGDPENAPGFWDIEKGKLTVALKASSSIEDAAFSPDGDWLATVDANSALKIWEVKTGKESVVISGEPEPYGMKTVAISPDGKLLATGDRTNRQTTIVRLFEVDDLLKKRKN